MNDRRPRYHVSPWIGPHGAERHTRKGSMPAGGDAHSAAPFTRAQLNRPPHLLFLRGIVHHHLGGLSKS
jgi:hypothetical protein